MRTFVVICAFVFLSGQISIAQSSSREDKNRLIVQDEGKYSKHFLTMLGQFVRSFTDDSKYEVVENTLKVSSKENKRHNYIVKFPSLPRFKTWYTLRAEKEGSLFELKLFQRNYTEVEFYIRLMKDSNAIYEKKGVADFSPSVFMAGEAYEDDKTKMGYVVNGYYSNTSDCPIWFSIGNTEEGLKGVINEIPCEGGAVIEMINKLPTLRQVK